MSKIIAPNQAILFMKVGVHANETLESIFARKTKEIEDAGFAFWGYGGNTCHPKSMVQPFARQVLQTGGKIFLCMQEMESKHFADPLRAGKFSVDGLTWSDVPTPINVLGSRFALAIKNLHIEKFSLPLDKSVVALGGSAGRTGDKYVAGRVDKACLTLTDAVEIPTPPDEGKRVDISLVAELCEPFAVFLKN